MGLAFVLLLIVGMFGVVAEPVFIPAWCRLAVNIGLVVIAVWDLAGRAFGCTAAVSQVARHCVYQGLLSCRYARGVHGRHVDTSRLGVPHGPPAYGPPGRP